MPITLLQLFSSHCKRRPRRQAGINLNICFQCLSLLCHIARLFALFGHGRGLISERSVDQSASAGGTRGWENVRSAWELGHADVAGVAEGEEGGGGGHVVWLLGVGWLLLGLRVGRRWAGALDGWVSMLGIRDCQGKG